MKITFNRPEAWCIFCSMAEGMSEVAADVAEDGGAVGFEIASLSYDLLIERIGKVLDRTDPFSAYPATVTLPQDSKRAAESVLDNCTDNARDSDEDDALRSGDVTIED